MEFALPCRALAAPTGSDACCGHQPGTTPVAQRSDVEGEKVFGGRDLRCKHLAKVVGHQQPFALRPSLSRNACREKRKPRIRPHGDSHRVDGRRNEAWIGSGPRFRAPRPQHRRTMAFSFSREDSPVPGLSMCRSPARRPINKAGEGSILTSSYGGGG
jgi:hypothetical protein